MANLTDLELNQLTPKYLSALLRGIRVPQCSRLQLQCNVLDRSDVDGNIGDTAIDHLAPIPFLNDTLLQLQEPLKKMLSRRDHNNVLLHITTSTLFFRQDALPPHPHIDSPTLSVNLRGIPLIQTLQWITETFRKELATLPIKMTVIHGFAWDPSFLTILGYLEATNEIKILSLDDTVDLNPYLDFLRNPFTHLGVRRWRLPSLRSLTISSTEGCSSLLPMLRSRYGKDEPTTTTDGMNVDPTELPLPFKTLMFPASWHNPALAHQLKAIVGEGFLSEHMHVSPQPTI